MNMERLRDLIEETRQLRVTNEEAARKGQAGRYIDAAYCVCRERALKDAWYVVTGKEYSMFQVDVGFSKGG